MKMSSFAGLMALVLASCNAAPEPQDSAPKIRAIVQKNVDGTSTDLVSITQERYVAAYKDQPATRGRHTLRFVNGQIIEGEVCLETTKEDLGCYPLETLSASGPEGRETAAKLQMRFVEYYDRYAVPILAKIHSQEAGEGNLSPPPPSTAPKVTNTT